MEQFIGCDAHKKFSVFVTVNEKGQAGEALRVLHDRQLYREFLGRSHSAIAVEASGRHVRDGSHNHSRAGLTLRHGLRGVARQRSRFQLRQTEIREFRVTVLGDQDVIRLEIPMQDPGLVRGGQAIGYSTDSIRYTPIGVLGDSGFKSA